MSTQDILSQAARAAIDMVARSAPGAVALPARPSPRVLAALAAESGLGFERAALVYDAVLRAAELDGY